MKNVYDAVRGFYGQDAAWNDILKYEWVDGFLRQKAWQDYNDKKLQDVWHHLLMLSLYLAYSDTFIEDAQSIDCEEMLYWLDRNVAEFSIDSSDTQGFFATVIDFHDYLAKRKIALPSDCLKKSFKSLQNKGFFTLKEKRIIQQNNNPLITPDAPAPIYLKLDEHLQELLMVINKFYQKKEYVGDIERAMFLFYGIMGWEDDQELDSQEFWLGFWDYFIFDYHLIKNDKTPLQNFFDSGNYPSEMTFLLKELVKANFSVFFVRNLTSQEWLECEDLFTGKTFFLPSPIEDPSGLKDLLFVGHLFSENMVLINYIMSVPVSKKLRKRIKEEVEKLFSLYCYQNEPNSWDGFFSRHAVAVRHTIEIFTGFSQINAVADFQVPPIAKYLPEKIESKVLFCLFDVLKVSKFSQHDCNIAAKMWLDFCTEHKVVVKKPHLWASGILANFLMINSPLPGDYKYISELFGVRSNLIVKYQKKIAQILDIKENDLRYLNEEGFIMLLNQ